MANNIVCIATFIAKPNKTKTLQTALTALLMPTRSEPGCLSYELCLGVDNAALFTMIEKFIDIDAFNFHGNQPYLLEFKDMVGELVESVSVNLYKVNDHITKN